MSSRFTCDETAYKTKAQARKEWASEWAQARRAETQYASRLRRIAAVIGDIIKGFGAESWYAIGRITHALKSYADILEPWAKAVSNRMISDVAKRDEQQWRKISQKIGVGYHEMIRNAPIGQVIQELQHEQVHLITSLPLKAAERVHELALQAVEEGKRFTDIADEIYNLGNITRSRSTLIARTEVARVQTTILKARAEHIGGTEFVWRTAHDASVRPSHKKLDGKTFTWEQGAYDEAAQQYILPGGIYNCRCVAIPLLPLEL